MAFDTNTYPLPTASAFVDIAQYVPILLAAIDAELDRSDVWNESEVDIALGYVQDLKAWLVDNLPPPTTPGATMYALVRDQKTQNTNGGGFSAGAWRTRDLNTVVTDGGFLTLASNQITLPAGTYRCHIRCPAYQVSRHQARLYNATDGLTLALGSSVRTAPTGGTQNESVIVGFFTLADEKVLEVQQRCESSLSNTGFGVAANFDVEIYTTAEFWKES